MSAAQPIIEPSAAGWGRLPGAPPRAPRQGPHSAGLRHEGAPAEQPVPDDPPLRPAGLCALLRATARANPTRIAFTDGGDKRAWCARPPMTWSYGIAAEIVGRLGRALRTWRLAPGSRIGLWFPGSTEGLIAHLAVEAAGHVPCPLPPSWTEAQAAAGIEAAGLSAVLTQARWGAVRPAESLCRIAVGYFGLRYLASFGPDVPDGVINLDALALDRGGEAVEPALGEGGGLVSFAGGDPACPVHRPADALLAAVALHLRAARIDPDDRILTLLPPSDLRGIVTGLGAALAAGAGLETMPVFDRAGLAVSLVRPAHLVAPAFLEDALSTLPLPDTVLSLALAHRAPMRFRPRADQSFPVLDVLAFDEDAILSGARGEAGLARTLAEPGRLALPPALFGLRREPDGRLAFRGQACATGLVRRGEDEAAGPGTFRISRFRADLFAGTAIAVSEA